MAIFKCVGFLIYLRILHRCFFAAFFTCRSACCFIVFRFSLSFTTCFRLRGHLELCEILHIFIFIYLRISLRCYFSLPFSRVPQRAALLYVGFHCLSLHLSAYMAIFKGVGFFIYLRILLRCYFAAFFTCRSVCCFVVFRFHCLSLHSSAYMAIFMCEILHIFIFTYLRILLRCYFSLPSSRVLLYCMLISTVFHYMFLPTSSLLHI
jgi:hypothetical protein